MKQNQKGWHEVFRIVEYQRQYCFHVQNSSSTLRFAERQFSCDWYLGQDQTTKPRTNHCRTLSHTHLGGWSHPSHIYYNTLSCFRNSPQQKFSSIDRLKKPNTGVIPPKSSRYVTGGSQSWLPSISCQFVEFVPLVRTMQNRYSRFQGNAVITVSCGKCSHVCFSH